MFNQFSAEFTRVKSLVFVKVAKSQEFILSFVAALVLSSNYFFLKMCSDIDCKF